MPTCNTRQVRHSVPHTDTPPVSRDPPLAVLSLPSLSRSANITKGSLGNRVGLLEDCEMFGKVEENSVLQCEYKTKEEVTHTDVGPLHVCCRAHFD